MHQQIANSDSHFQGLLKVICSNDIYLPYSHAGGLGRIVPGEGGVLEPT